MNLKNTQCEDVGWIQLAHSGGICEHGIEHSDTIKDA
jgi:hypothetical protein